MFEKKAKTLSRVSDQNGISQNDILRVPTRMVYFKYDI